ncbi:type 2 isopentenyl-diphosphate Delta-isomerase [Phenylobacterium deserti]|uniref:Isopentenyl-diphosphate delta-isomerase n=1 Tax=Phenylobacterium deserti TaxID=1914756 RepID=A0A328AI25_9CAUL|nr:type 2 isopentenyl-diphosphate Delta-isomerase [Phenylobacterium deserti]RAK52498.1 type 2 isopentenyl-diphosphate Delta-isomerase [Phenylobacterium deserti]
MTDSQHILRRKDEHLDIALKQGVGGVNSSFDSVALEHCALPELDLDQVDLSTEFLGRRLALPFLISSMTGGPQRGASINAHLAEAAEALQIPMAVGSQRVAIEGEAAGGIDSNLRRLAPTTPIWANLGAAQLVLGYGVDEARRAVEMIGADALIIHLNPLQEAVQPAGDRTWTGVLNAIQTLASGLGRPIIIKEVGYGVSAQVAGRLRDAGVAAIDVAGAGGTAWAAIEAERAPTQADKAVAEAFTGWGIPTPLALLQVRSAYPDLPLIGSGGIRHGVDAAKAIRLGADLVGQAGGVLAAALVSPDAVMQHFEILAQQLRIACFCTGSANLQALKSVRLLPLARPIHDL